jgi:hypothetical protein
VGQKLGTITHGFIILLDYPISRSNPEDPRRWGRRVDDGRSSDRSEAPRSDSRDAPIGDDGTLLTHWPLRS